MKEKRAAVYLRVSTTEQTPESQALELREFVSRRGWKEVIYCDRGQSGAKENRPALDQMLADIRKRKIDVVVVWALDRLARSLKQLLALAEEFKALAVDLVSYQQNIDTSTPSGKLTYSVLGAVAEFERELLRSRIRSGLLVAKAKGKRLGRHPMRCLSAEEIRQLRRDRIKEKLPFRSLAKRHGVSVWTAHRLCTREG